MLRSSVARPSIWLPSWIGSPITANSRRLALPTVPTHALPSKTAACTSKPILLSCFFISTATLIAPRESDTSECLNGGRPKHATAVQPSLSCIMCLNVPIAS